MHAREKYKKMKIDRRAKCDCFVGWHSDCLPARGVPSFSKMCRRRIRVSTPAGSNSRIRDAFGETRPEEQLLIRWPAGIGLSNSRTRVRFGETRRSELRDEG